MTNPSQLITTDSFKISTMTQDGYLIDSRETGIVISFECISSCKTCVDGYSDKCQSCDSDKVLYEDQCVEECPLGLVSVDDGGFKSC